MKKIVYLVVFAALVISVESKVAFAQGDSNLASRLFKGGASAAKTTKAKVTKSSVEVKKATKKVVTVAKTTVKKVEKATTKTTKSAVAITKNVVKPITKTVAKTTTTKPITNSITKFNSTPSTAKSATPNPKTTTTSTAYKNVVSKKLSKFKITVVTQKPDVEVFIDDELAGKTNQKSEFAKEIEEGTYNISAKYSDEDVVEKTVNIEKNQTIYLTKDERNNIDESGSESTVSTLKIEQTKVPEFIETTPTPEPKKVEPVVVATPAPVVEPKKVEVIEPKKEAVVTLAEQLQNTLNKYYQPTTSDNLNESDWQFIRQTILSGETGSLSQQDIDMFSDLSLGKLDFFKRNFNTAISNFKKAIETNPKSPFPALELANTYYQNKDYRTAVSYYKTALEINPNLWHAQVKYSRSLLRIGDTATASQILEKVNQSDFKSSEITTLTAETFVANKQFDKAISLLFAETSENPKLENCLVLAEAFEKTFVPNNAIKFLKMADELAPNNPRILLKLGELFLLIDKAQALSFLNKAIELDKNGAYINLTEAQKLVKRASK